MKKLTIMLFSLCAVPLIFVSIKYYYAKKQLVSFYYENIIPDTRGLTGWYQMNSGKEEARVDRTIFFCGDNAQTLIYESEDSFSKTGKAVFDKEASGEGAIYYEGGKDESGHLVYGPYQRFPEGAYEATFRLKVDDNSTAEEVALLDVVARGSLFLGTKSLKGADFTKNNVYRDFSLKFCHQEGDRDLEFRVYAEGKTNLWADKVSISLDLQEWMRRRKFQLFPKEKAFSIVWRGLLKIKTSKFYRIGTTSDDDSALYIDGVLLVDNRGEHLATKKR